VNWWYSAGVLREALKIQRKMLHHGANLPQATIIRVLN
jgi:hypothetical protein